MNVRSSVFLRRVLLLDAVSAGAMGLGMLLLTDWLAGLLKLPVDLISEAGMVLLPFAAFVGFLATREQPSRAGVWIVIGLNALWAIDSIALLLTGWVQPSMLGYTFVAGQAVAVAVFAELEYIGLRRSQLVAA